MSIRRNLALKKRLWKELVYKAGDDPSSYPERGCVGFYEAPNARVPDTAASATEQLSRIRYKEPFNPFEGV